MSNLGGFAGAAGARNWKVPIGERVARAAGSTVAASRGIRKPLLAVLPGNPGRTSVPMGKLAAAGIPAFTSLERAVSHLAAYRAYQRWRG